MKTYTTHQGDMLDLICHAYYGKASGAVETVLEANPGLADLGPIFEQGVEIELPDIAVSDTPLISLFG